MRSVMERSPVALDPPSQITRSPDVQGRTATIAEHVDAGSTRKILYRPSDVDRWHLVIVRSQGRPAIARMPSAAVFVRSDRLPRPSSPGRRGLGLRGVAQRAPLPDHRPDLGCSGARSLRVGDVHAFHGRAYKMRVAPMQAPTPHEPKVHAGLAVPDESGEVAALR